MLNPYVQRLVDFLGGGYCLLWQGFHFAICVLPARYVFGAFVENMARKIQYAAVIGWDILAFLILDAMHMYNFNLTVDMDHLSN